MDLVLPAPTRQITKVTCNGKPVKWEPQPGFGISQIRVQVPSCGKALLEISCQDSLPFYPAVELAAITGEKITLEAPETRIVEFRDSQGAVTEAKIHDGKIIGKVSANTGHHLVLALAEVGSLRQWREFKLDITDPAAEARKQAKLLDRVPEGAQWECLDLAPVFNGDIRAIFQQKYLSPRPKTVAAGLRGWVPVMDDGRGQDETSPDRSFEGAFADKRRPSNRNSPRRSLPGLERGAQYRLHLAMGQLAQEGRDSGPEEGLRPLVPGLRLIQSDAMS